jgi:hypothetical protein
LSLGHQAKTLVVALRYHPRFDFGQATGGTSFLNCYNAYNFAQKLKLIIQGSCWPRLNKASAAFQTLVFACSCNFSHPWRL